MSSNSRDKKRAGGTKSEDTRNGTTSDARDSKRLKTEETKKPKKFSERDIFNCEVNAIKSRNPISDLSEFRETLGGIRESLTVIRDLKRSKDKTATAEIVEQRIFTSLGIARLRKLNRYGHLGCSAAKEATNEKRGKNDEYHLKLQNLLYEVGHLQKEINKCLEFRSKDEDLKLVSVEEFYKEAPTEISQADLTKDNPHEQRKARLQWEMEQRKILSEQLQTTRKQIDAVQSDIQTRETNIESLGPKLTKILEATRPVQEYLGMPLENQRDQYDTAPYLPRPLYTLYRNFTCLETQKRDGFFNVGIEGDVDAAKTYNSANNEANDDSDSDQEEETHKKSKHRRRLTSTSNQDVTSRILKQHPLKIHVEMRLENTNAELSDPVKIHAFFHYLTELEIITVSCKMDESMSSSSISAGELLQADSIFSCLYKDDKGQANPNPATATKLNKLPIPDITHYKSAIGTPYKWAQEVAGLLFLPSDSKENKPVTVRQLVRRMNQHVLARVQLVQQLCELERCNLLLPETTSQLLPSYPPACKLVKWTKVLYEDLCQVKHAADFVNAGIISSQWTIYEGKFTCLSMKVTCHVAVKDDYPSTPPILILDINDSQLGSINRANSDLVMCIESEINKDMTPYLKKKSDVLCLQLMKLSWCCDVLIAVDSHKRGKHNSVNVKFMPMSLRGRNRHLPLHFNSKTGFFEHQ